MKFNKYISICSIIVFVVLTIICLFAFGIIKDTMVFIIGSIILGIGVLLIFKTIQCGEKVSALLVDYGFEQYKAHITSSPLFKYTYQGEEHTENASECLSQRYVLKHFKEGEIYTVYISPQNPSFLKINKHISIFDLILCLFGVAIIISSTLSIFH